MSVHKTRFTEYRQPAFTPGCDEPRPVIVHDCPQCRRPIWSMLASDVMCPTAKQRATR